MLEGLQNEPIWSLRYIFFSKFDEGIEYDEMGFRSTKPEEISKKLARIVKGEVVFDGFCGLGSNAIGFALEGKTVITCDVDSVRLSMAQNNARVYGVEDKITFIHGSVFDCIGAYDYDVAYFDPPWSTDGVYYLDKGKFKFSNYGIDGRELIARAKQKADNIVFALPKNFDFTELYNLGMDGTVTREVTNNELFLYTLYLGTDYDFSDYRDSVVGLRELNATIFDAFINISESLPDYAIRKIVYNNTLHYLRQALLKTPDDKHYIVFAGYRDDTEKIISFCQSFLDTPGTQLSETFIQQLHILLYPEGYIQRTKDAQGREFIWMIPGEYRTIDIVSRSNTNKEVYLKAKDVKTSMKKRVLDYNLNTEERERNILYFLVDFFIIHPFGDGNGRVAYIVTDILLLKNNLPPRYFGMRKENDKIGFYRILDSVHETRNIQPFYEFLEKYPA